MEKEKILDAAYKKARKIGISDMEASTVVSNFKEFIEFNDKQTEFMEYLFELLEADSKEEDAKQVSQN